MTSVVDDDLHEPLISNRLLLRVTALIGCLALLATGLGVVGREIGQDIALGGHTDSRQIHHIVVGQDTLALPANIIRFETQRRNGATEAVNLYLSWPALKGYDRKTAALFSDPLRTDRLIFADLSQSVMSRDMSGRIEPIYSKLYTGTTRAGPAGLTVHALSRKSGFGDEQLLTGTLADGTPYAVRCLLPAEGGSSTAADCLRDIRVGRDLTLLYRFSSTLLPQWRAIEQAMKDFAASHLQK